MWDRAVNFAVNIVNVVDSIAVQRTRYRLFEQIEAASASVSLNLAEGKGRFSKNEFIQYCYIARGSLYETMTLLEIYKRKGWISNDTFSEIKSDGIEIASMIKGLINALKKKKDETL